MVRKPTLFAAFILAFACVLAFPQAGNAAPMRDRPRAFAQPDGTVVECLASGDEFFNYLHDKDGSLIMRAEDGYYVYAALGADGSPVPAGGYVNRADAVSGQARGGSAPRITVADIALPKDEIERRAAKYGSGAKPALLQFSAQAAPKDVANIVMFIAFADTDVGSFLSTLPEMEFCMAEMSAYFKEVSYGQSAVYSTALMDGSDMLVYIDGHNRGYYRPNTISPRGYDPSISYEDDADQNGSTYREHMLLKDAVEALREKIPAGTELDYDGDGYVDNLTFILEGIPDGWDDMLWAHRWMLWSQDAEIQGKIVYDYNFIPSADYVPGTAAHEMFHSFGAPDLYHYENGLMPVGAWDIMEYCDIYDFQHMTAYMKQRYGYWMDGGDIPEITRSGRYALRPLSAAKSAYRIGVPGSATQSIYLEYRNGAAGRYENLLDSPEFGGLAKGLLVYRVCETVEDGNAFGPPDQLYVFRQDDINTEDYYATLDHVMATGARRPGEFIGRDASYSLLRYDADNPTSGTGTSAVNDIRISVASMSEDEIVFDVAFAHALTLDGAVSGGTAKVSANSDAGAGVYRTTLAGSVVGLTAAEAQGCAFSHWASYPAGVVFADAKSASTTFTMPDFAVTITPVFTAAGANAASGAASPPVIWMPPATPGTAAAAPVIGGTSADRYDARSMMLRGYVLDAASYQWQALVDGAWIDIEGADAAEFLYTGLESGKEYTVRLAAANAKGTAYSDPLTFIVNDPGAPRYTESQPAARASLSYYNINVRALNIREGMSTSSKKLGSLTRSDMIYGEDMGNGWVRFTWKGKDAYLSMGAGKYLSKR